MEIKNNNNLNYELSEIVSNRFERYAKYIIQERALPDVRDGLKPVQRRTLYAMDTLGLTHEKPHKKSARIVGEVIGKYHPHGDTSIYEAMVRLSQWWKNMHCLIDMHGNNGSIDGDSAAAMRYTESRLSAIASYLLKDLEKETIEFTPNFDDSEKEPTVLPAYFPNLLVNGAAGIAAGYATNIPPHNLEEVINGLIERIKNPNSSLEQIMRYIKGPDFPTGAIIQGIDGIKNAYKTGKGKIVIRSKLDLETNEKMKTKNWIITEIPYEVIKQDLIKKIDDIRFFQKIPGIKAVRDESDRHGLRIVIEMNYDSDHDAIAKYLFKNTNLQIYYNFNLVVINNKSPKQSSLLEILDAYIDHQKVIVNKRCHFDLKKANNRLEIVEGLIKAISILDQVITMIRKSNNKNHAKINLIKAFSFTEIQAEAIVNLRLYRLTSTDILQLTTEKNELLQLIQELNKILANPLKLNEVIIEQWKEVLNKFKIKRQSTIEATIEEIVIDEQTTILEKEVFVSVSRDGYIKLIDHKLQPRLDMKEYGRKPLDMIIATFTTTTLKTLLVFTSNGNYCIIPLHKVKESRWREIGNHINTLSSMSGAERVLGVILITNFDIENYYVILATRNGLIKKTAIKDFQAVRISKAISCIKLKNQDEVISMILSNDNEEVIVTTKTGLATRYREQDIPIVGVKAAGVKSINLKKDDQVVAVNIANNKLDNYILITNNGIKRIKTNLIPLFNRPAKGIRTFKIAASNLQNIITAFVLNNTNKINILLQNNTIKTINIKDYNFTNLETYPSKLQIDNIEWVDHQHLYDLTNITNKIKTRSIKQQTNKETNKNINTNEDSKTKDFQISFDDLLNDD